MLLDGREYRLAFILQEGVEKKEVGKTTLIKTLEAHWHKAHVHKRTNETYTVYTGFIVYAVLEDGGRVILHRYDAGEDFLCRAGTPHAIFSSANALFSTAKAPVTGSEYRDWHSVPELDELVKKVPQDRFDVYLQ